MATNLNEMYGQMESEYRSTPTSRSEELWELQYETDMRSRNPNLETILEKSGSPQTSVGRLERDRRAGEGAAGGLDSTVTAFT